MAGPAALPRVNGELVYESPWQRRAFGTAVATTRHLGLDWDQFRVRLIAAIADQPDRPSPAVRQRTNTGRPRQARRYAARLDSAAYRRACRGRPVFVRCRTADAG